MIFSINTSATEDMQNIMQAFQQIANDLQNHFANISFGGDLCEFYIGLIAVSPEFSLFFKPKKDKYIRGPKKRSIDGVEIVLRKAFEMEILLPHEILVHTSIEESIKIICTEIITSMTRLRDYNNVIKDFLIDDFIQETKYYFLNKNLLNKAYLN